MKRATALLVALGVVLTALPSVADSGRRRSTFASRIRKLLPKGWTLETSGLPDGVEGIAIGPRSDDGRAIVLLSLLSKLPNKTSLDDPRTRSYIEGRLEETIRVTETSVNHRGPLGHLEISALDKSKRQVRYLVADGRRPFLLIVVAPNPVFPSAYRSVVNLAKRMRESQKL